MALYFFSISTILGGPGGPLAARGTDGFSSLFSHSDIESEPVPLTSDFCKFFCQMLGKKGKLQQIVDFFLIFTKRQFLLIRLRQILTQVKWQGY